MSINEAKLTLQGFSNLIKSTEKQLKATTVSLREVRKFTHDTVVLYKV